MYVAKFKPGGMPNDRLPKHIVFANRLLKKVARDALKDPMNKSAKALKQIIQPRTNNETTKADFLRLLRKHNLLTEPYLKYVSNANARTLQAHLKSIKEKSRR